MLEKPDFNHDSPGTCVNKLFNMIQACRTTLVIMDARPESYNIDDDIIKVAESLAKSLKESKRTQAEKAKQKAGE